MTGAHLIEAHDYQVTLDYGTFNLITGDIDPEDPLRALDAATDGIGQLPGIVCIASPHQNNFAMPLRVEVWDAEPDSDIDDWQEAFEVHLDVGAAGLTYDSPTCELVELAVPAGAYHALITGRGFVAVGWPGSTTPGDSWRLRLWPSTGPAVPQRLRSYQEPAVHHPDPVFRDAGVAAVRRLHRALDDDLAASGQLSGQRGTARAERRLPGSRRTLFPSFRNPSGWLTSGSGGADGGYLICAYRYDDEAFGDANRIVPCNGEIVGAVTDDTSPASVTATWTWCRLPPDRLAPERRDGRPPGDLIPDPVPTLRFDLEAAGKAADGTPLTLVRVTHDHVPTEWVDDLAAYWTWMLERADYDFDLGGARRAGHRT